jgi:hypothetical protein
MYRLRREKRIACLSVSFSQIKLGFLELRNHGMNGLHVPSYDEDRWPSGTTGGQVIQNNPDNKQKHLLFTPNFRGAVGPTG